MWKNAQHNKQFEYLYVSVGFNIIPKLAVNMFHTLHFIKRFIHITFSSKFDVVPCKTLCNAIPKAYQTFPAKKSCWLTVSYIN